MHAIKKSICFFIDPKYSQFNLSTKHTKLKTPTLLPYFLHTGIAFVPRPIRFPKPYRSTIGFHKLTILL